MDPVVLTIRVCFHFFEEEDSRCSWSRCCISTAFSCGRLTCLIAGDLLISPQFRKIHLPPQWPINDQFPLQKYYPRYPRCECASRLVSVRPCMGGLLNAEVCFQPRSSLLGKILASVIPFSVRHKPFRVIWRGDSRLELFSVGFDPVKTDQEILLKRCSVGVGGFSFRFLWVFCFCVVFVLFSEPLWLLCCLF